MRVTSSRAGVGGKQVSIEIDQIKILRDVYYIAPNVGGQSHRILEYQYWDGLTQELHPESMLLGEIYAVFRDPRLWDSTPLWDARHTVEYDLADNQFLPLGDNSPRSKDARLWSDDPFITVGPYVERDMLIGRPFVLYWPHAWPAGTNVLPPFIPNFSRMGWIR